MIRGTSILNFELNSCEDLKSCSCGYLGGWTRVRLVIGFAIQKRSCVVSRRTNRSCVVSRRTVCMYRFILNYIFIAFRNV